MKLAENSILSPKKPSPLVGKRNAYHMAGHIAAIHIGNSQKGLIAVHFKIAIQSCEKENGSKGRFARIPKKFAYKLEGGRLLPDLSFSSFQDVTRRLSATQKLQCQCAIEADVINLLAGSLAEAKYVAQRDGEVFNANLVYLGALKYYGGSQDMEIINEYMECMYEENKIESKKKMAELFLAAYSFVNEQSNWLAITRLAEAIHCNSEDTFTCEELIALLDLNIQADSMVFVNQPSNSRMKRLNF
jgi:hypothetical protein